MSKSINLINLHLINKRSQATCQSADPGTMFEKQPATSGLLRLSVFVFTFSPQYPFSGLCIVNARGQQKVLYVPELGS